MANVEDCGVSVELLALVFDVKEDRVAKLFSVDLEESRNSCIG